MSTYTLSFREIDRSKLMVAGGKGANLGELSGIREIQVPDGFCVTIEAYKEIIVNNREFDALLDQLSFLKADNHQCRSHVHFVP